MRRVIFLAGIAVTVGCHESPLAPVRSPELACAPGSVAPASFAFTADPGTVLENRVTLPHRYADTVWVFDHTTAVIFAKSGGRCQTLFDSLLARHNPPIVSAR